MRTQFEWRRLPLVAVLLFSLLRGTQAAALKIQNQQDQPVSPAGAPNSDPVYSSFYTVNESPEVDSQSLESSAHFNPLKMIAALPLDMATDLPGQIIDLLKWDEHHSNFGSTPEKYNRIRHFGTWIKKSFEGKCFYTRAEVLARDSKQNVERSPTDPCIVVSGLWVDPYTGNTIQTPKDLQIDHFVPLKNAYIAGAWAWTEKKRCAYANFLENNIHLLSVSGIENMTKGASGPDQYLPPDQSFVCNYLQRWLKIKLIWNLGLNPTEAEAIASTQKEHGCLLGEFTMSTKDLKQQRDSIQKDSESCGN